MRSNQVSRIERALGKRRLVWFGTRGHDGVPYVVLPQFVRSHAVTAPVAVAALEGLTLEGLTGHRLDLDRWDLDEDRSNAVAELRQVMLAEANEPTVIVGYRPSRFLSSLGFARQGAMTVAAMFHEHHRPFEHKPWIETQLSSEGIPVIPWTYVADEHRTALRTRLRRGPLMLRPSRGSGGVGLARIEEADDLDSFWPRHPEGFVSVAPFLEDVVPLNVTACVNPLGPPQVHAPSLQLIGLEACTNEPFGYCGNDYAAVKRLPVEVIEDVERITMHVGEWLRARGYVGAYGVDFLLERDKLWFSELNARFQGGSLLSARVAESLDCTDIYLDHLAAFLKIEPTQHPPLPIQVRDGPSAAHVVIHNRTSGPLRRTRAAAYQALPEGTVDLQLLSTTDTLVEPGAVLCRLVLDRGVTTNGMDLDDAVAAACLSLSGCFEPVDR